ncbi:MAG: L-histidine N(alpha)-methyltransferase [Acidobacteria bacterium]|nr:L-histidine N(alpha)-methyltransferase [Acidobacteriota bacterium]
MPTQLNGAIALEELVEEVREGLGRSGQKELPSKYLYDDIGSALFEVISLLPEYGLTRADERLLRKHSRAIVTRISLPTVVAELGSGSGKKTRWILEALAQRKPTTYHPIEISSAALAMCRKELSDIESLSIVGHERRYLDGLARVAADRSPGEHLLVLFLGSTIGNFDRPAGGEFLAKVRQVLRSGDALLLGTDLEKPVDQLLGAYDDPLGVTAAFNLNLLARLNRQLDADFNLGNFRHLARYNHEERRIEMHLLSAQDQTVSVGKADFSVAIRKNETIWTESSHKYSLDEVAEMAGRSGFRCDAQWVDREWPFAESLFIAR